MKNCRSGITVVGLIWTLVAVIVLFGGIWFAVSRFLRSDGVSEISAEEKVEGAIQKFEDPLTCVDAYYRAVVRRDHHQYQFCVMEPLSGSNFVAKVSGIVGEREKDGFKPIREPVRGRTDYKDFNGVKGVDVFAISPWTGKEARYTVLTQGQSWKIAEEK